MHIDLPTKGQGPIIPKVLLQLNLNEYDNISIC